MSYKGKFLGESGVPMVNLGNISKNADFIKKKIKHYSGEFKNDVFYGDGTYRWEDGTLYVGKWAANKKHGRGYFNHGTGHKAYRNFNFDERVYDERFEFSIE